MHLLAQINFIDTPALDPFPRDGLLQIYIDSTHDLYGMSLSEEAENERRYKVLYIPNQGAYEPTRDLSFLKEPEEFPVEGENQLFFYKDRKPFPIENPRFEEVYHKYCGHLIDGKDFFDIYAATVNSTTTHKIGGYPCFAQAGPSYLEEDPSKYEVLLQIGYDHKICFGDAGIASFLISAEDLKKLDFSKGRYYWDCS